MTAEVRNAFLMLLHNSLWQKPLIGFAPLKPEQWEELFAFAEKHTLLGTLYDSLSELPKDNGLSPELLLTWVMRVRTIEQRCKLQKAVIEAQQKAWERHGIKAELLKGLTVASMYRVPEHRTSGDIDWYFPTHDDWHKANDVAHSNGCELEMDSDGDVHYLVNGVVVEHHLRWNDASSTRARAVLDALSIETPVARLLLLNVHILKHALVAGIGLRQFCDLALAYKFYEGQYEREELDSLLEAAGLTRWNALLNAFLVELIGCECIQHDEVPRKDLDRLVEMVFADGNFGQHRSDGFAKHRLQYMMKSFVGRGLFFFRYAPGEQLGRLTSLLRGRAKRKLKN